MNNLLYGLLLSIAFLVMVPSGAALADSVPKGVSAPADAAEKPYELLQRLVGLTTNKGGMQKILVELAVTPEEWEHGLMGRTDLAGDAGMLFDFGAERPIAMWMKDTPLSLDMLFIADNGRVVAIARDTVPFSEAVIRAPQPVRYVLEVRGGQSALWGVEPGAQLVQISR